MPSGKMVDGLLARIAEKTGCNFVMGDLILVVDERAHGVIGQWVSSRTCTPTVTDMSEM